MLSNTLFLSLLLVCIFLNEYDKNRIGSADINVKNQMKMCKIFLNVV